MSQLNGDLCRYEGCQAKASKHVIFNIRHSEPRIVEEEGVAKALTSWQHSDFCETHLGNVKGLYADVLEYELGTCSSQTCPLQQLESEL